MFIINIIKLKKIVLCECQRLNLNSLMNYKKKIILVFLFL